MSRVGRHFGAAIPACIVVQKVGCAPQRPLKNSAYFLCKLGLVMLLCIESLLYRVCILEFCVYSAKNNNFQLNLPVIWAASYTVLWSLTFGGSGGIISPNRERCRCRPKPAVVDAGLKRCCRLGS